MVKENDSILTNLSPRDGLFLLETYNTDFSLKNIVLKYS